MPIIQTKVDRKSEDFEKNRAVQFRDPKARHIIGWRGAGGPNRYYIENTLEGVNEPGEWYLDRQTGILYFWPTAPIESRGRVSTK